MLHRIYAVALFLLIAFPTYSSETWMGLVIKPENRCSAYDKSRDYSYPPSVEDQIIESMGGIVYGPYTGRTFTSKYETDIEHIVAASEAHDSGLCAQPVTERQRFARDLLNLTLAAPKVNRCSATGKCHLDAGEWLPSLNKCWFVKRIIDVKRQYNLSIDRAEAESLRRVYNACPSFEMLYYSTNNIVAPTAPSTPTTTANNRHADALSLYDSNNNGHITCKEAREHGIAPVRRGHAAYQYMSDRDGDGVVCE